MMQPPWEREFPHEKKLEMCGARKDLWERRSLVRHPRKWTG
jgi:hypothetical protein